MSKVKDLIGKKFSRLTVVSKAENQGHYTMWNCRCDCGVIKAVRASHLTLGRTLSCGCLKREKIAKTLTKHGHSRIGNKTPEYNAWGMMKSRCDRKSNSMFYRYGGRGIKYSAEWAYFSVFLSDMGLKPSPKHSLDRIDNDGDYCRENCRWATQIVQANNKSSSRHIEFRGETLTITQWERRLNLTPFTLHGRLRRGWSVERAFTEPIGNNAGARL